MMILLSYASFQHHLSLCHPLLKIQLLKASTESTGPQHTMLQVQLK